MSSKSWSQLVSSETAAVVDTSEETTPYNETIYSKSFVSLNDVMSEQLVESIETRSESSLVSRETNSNEKSGGSEHNESECQSDALLALLLQHEFDRQHDHNLKKEEQKHNMNSKVSISYDRFRRIRESCDHLSDESEEEKREYEFGEESPHWDAFERWQRQEVQIGRQGFAVRNGVVTTKHDPVRSARRNACKAMETLNLETGDGGCFDMQLNNNVYNALKVHSIHEGKRMARLHERKERSTAEKVLDEKSRILVLKMLNRGVLDTVNGVVATGKEAVVLHGRGQNAEKGITEGEVAIKIFKTTLNEFRNRVQYVCDDPLLQQTSRLSRQNPKLMIPLWAEKEMHNLNRIRRNGILCPEVLLLKKHILVMTFIGEEGRPAPTLKDAHLSEEELRSAWKQTVEMLSKLFRDCDLIHADFSEYNLLWHKNKLYCIDVSQAVLSTHPMAYKFLWRDCNNIQRV